MRHPAPPGKQVVPGRPLPDGRALPGCSSRSPPARAWLDDVHPPGTYKPKRIFNGGDPAGLIYGITWTGWGQPDAYGYGTGILGTTELRAFDLGRCTTNGLRAYRFLDVRQPSKSGGKLGGWSSWNDNQTIC